MLFVLSLCGFASAMSGRLVDPAVLDIAADLGAPVQLVALLSTAYTLPFALSQPMLGPLGDLVAKGRIVKIAIVAMTAFLALSWLAPGLPTLFGSRVLAGVSGAAILPIGFALIGDSFPMATRQLAISRFLAATLIGQLVGASASGLVSHALGWRASFLAAAAVTGIIAVAALLRLPEARPVRTTPPSLSAALANYASVLQNLRARVCFGVVFVEGAAIYGWLPFLGDFLRALGLGGVREAGFVISGLAIGGVAYSLSVPMLLRRLERRQMMAAGGAVASIGFLCLSLGAAWPAQWAFMGVTGFGFFLLHNPIQTEVSELAPDARASAFSLHSFCFYVGQALGPVLYAAGSHAVGLPACLVVSACAFLMTGFAASRLLR